VTEKVAIVGHYADLGTVYLAEPDEVRALVVEALRRGAGKPPPSSPSRSEPPLHPAQECAQTMVMVSWPWLHAKATAMPDSPSSAFSVRLPL